jgi:hypothetical protein
MLAEWERADPRDAWRHNGEPRPVESLDEYGERQPDLMERSAAPPMMPADLTLTIPEWRARKMKDPDFLLGAWLTTTSRVLVTAATGIGKSNFGMALAQRVSAGKPFLDWKAGRPAIVLYIDGEMSGRLLRTRVLDEAARHRHEPEYFYALSHEDIEGFAPLNTPAGQAFVEQIIAEIGGVDLVIFDNVMSLTSGDQKDTLPWQQILPWVLSLTRRNIGQIWIHHTGHDETRGYGDKSREWQMDTVMHLEAIRREDTDVSFALSFRKARERTPTTRADFEDVKIALIDNQWQCDRAETRKPGHIAPLTAKALDALFNVLGSDQVVITNGQRCAKNADWSAECVHLGLIDASAKPHSARTLFAKFRRELVAANRIACDGDLSWLLR